MGEKMDEYRENTTVDKREEIKRKLRQYYDGRLLLVVPKFRKLKCVKEQEHLYCHF